MKRLVASTLGLLTVMVASASAQGYGGDTYGRDSHRSDRNGHRQWWLRQSRSLIRSERQTLQRPLSAL